MSLEIGALAPDFTAQTPAGPLRFREWLGQGWGVLFSHPGDFTPVCTTELGAAARLQGEFERRGVKIAALSVDSVEDHRAWSRDIAETQSAVVGFPMIADPDKTVAQLYGMIHAGESDAATVRTVFVIGPDKKIKMTMAYPASTGRNFAEIVRVIDSLQLTAVHQLGTPADWWQGEEVIVAPAVSDEEAARRFPGYRAVKPYLRITDAPASSA
jgi:alkyl hydroperoxide reductase subunit AhpC